MKQQTKYSLKTKQFTKRKHAIFQRDKSTSSLQIHEPQKQLNLFNDSFVNASNVSFRNSQQNLQKSQNSKHQTFHEPQSTSSAENQMILQEIRLRMVQNENKLNKMIDFSSRLYENVMNMYEKHAVSLGEQVKKRYAEFSGLMRKALKYVQKKQEELGSIEKRVWIFENTLRQSKETFRLIRIKQDCLQALIQNSNKQKLVKSKTESLVHLQNDTIIDQFDQQTYRNNNIESDRNRKQLLFERSSPFQANQLLISPKTNFNQEIISPLDKHDKPKLDQYSFNRYKEIGSRQSNRPKYQFSERIVLRDEDEQLHDHNENQHESVVYELLQKQEKYSLWVDALDCLRRKNGSYVLNEEGSPIINSPLVYRILRRENLLHRH